MTLVNKGQTNRLLGYPVDDRWGPVTSREKVPSLIDQAGHFYNFEHIPQFLCQVRLDQLEME